MIIYRVTNLINGKVYIGQTINTLKQRSNEHRLHSKNTNSGCPLFHRAVRKYGFAKFKWDIVFRTDNINNLNRMEQYMITFYRAMNRDFGYNLTSGGLNCIMSDYTKEKLSIARKGKKFTRKHKENLGRALKLFYLNNPKTTSPMAGSHHSKKAKDLIRQKAIKRYEEHPEIKLIGDNNPMYGKTHSPEIRKKIKQNMGDVSGENNGFYGKKHTSETIQEMKDTRGGENHPMWGVHLSEERKSEQRRIMKVLWQSPEYQEKQRLAQIKRRKTMKNKVVFKLITVLKQIN